MVAVVYSHSHVDHYGGVRGIVDEADVKAGKVQILAPEHFTEHAVTENVIAGNAMSSARRVSCMAPSCLATRKRRCDRRFGPDASAGTLNLDRTNPWR